MYCSQYWLSVTLDGQVWHHFLLLLTEYPEEAQPERPPGVLPHQASTEDHQVPAPAERSPVLLWGGPGGDQGERGGVAGGGSAGVRGVWGQRRVVLGGEGGSWGYNEIFGKVRYSSPPLIGTPLLPNNSVLIREVSFGEREHYIHSQYLLPRICVLSREVSSLESVL